MNDGTPRTISTLDSFDHLRVGLALFDPDDVLTYCNEHFRFIYRSLHEVDDLIGLPFEQILRIMVENGEIAGALVVQDPDKWIKRRLKIHRARVGITTERLTDGRWIDVKERLLPDGGVIGYWSDATERVRYQLRLESAMDCMADGFAAWNQAGQLDMFNAKFAERYSSADGPPKRGQKFEEVIQGLAHANFLSLEDAPDEWVQRQVEARRMPAHQGFLEYNDERFFILNEKRTLEGSVVTTLTDITELKEQERELIYRGQSLKQANAELEMAKEILERQGEELVAMAEDIELNRQALVKQKTALELIEARQRAILETMADSLIVVDDAAVVEIFNPNAEQMFGFDAEEVIGEPLDKILDGGFPGAFTEHVLDCVETGKTDDHRGIHQEMIGLRKDGSTFPVELAAADASVGPRRFFVLTVRDISDRKAFEDSLRRSQDILEEQVLERTGELTSEVSEHQHTMEKLIQAKEEAELANRTKSEFLANMSHELRTPLNAVIGFADTIQRETFGPVGNDKYQEYVYNIHESGQHLLELINDILDVSAIESGMLELHAEEIEVPRLIDESLRLVRPRAEKGQVRLATDMPASLPMIWADRRRIKQVLVNLLNNAVKFTPSGGLVLLAASGDGEDTLVFTVSDNGIGMDAEDMEKAMAPFGQVGSVMTRRHEGTGLGLPLTKGLVEAHAGSLKLDSTPGEGTTVTVRLPVGRAGPGA